ncbi:putative RNA-binding Zn ribbon-like protein [Streptacidiphilus sp. MAP12-33]|uniref:CGNR zinc finger domain-containing protein n=1 Tax=Streptacidiphilus sp. MAP12-33 TaxID=3156266 RepID=UPI003516B680
MPDDDLSFRLDCGATWLNLLATQGRHPTSTPIERIATPERLAAWLALHGLTPDAPVTEDDVRLAQELRRPIRALAWATVTRTPAPADAMRELGRFLRDHDEPVRLLTAEGGLRRAAPARTAGALSQVVRQAADQLTGPERLTLKACPEQDCLGIFSDPGGRRRWCPAPACASRGRVRALRARRAGTSDDHMTSSDPG